MTEETWNAVDAWFTERLSPTDSVLDAALEACEAAGMPSINVAPNQGKLLHLLARSINARTILEIGTLGGYSTIWLGRALPPDGRLVTLEVNADNAEVARGNIASAGLSAQIEIRIGPALDSLPRLHEERFGPVDFTFIDADKQHNTEYFEWALALSHPGSLIIVDNVVRAVRVIDDTSNDPSVHGTRRLIDRISGDPHVSATAIQTVGSKGYDGFLLARVE